MSIKTPIRTVFDESNNATGLAEYQSGEFIGLTHGGIGASLSIGSAGQVLKVNSGASALEFGNVEAVFNIDGMTDGSGITIVDADDFAISDAGVEKRVNASQIATYVQSGISGDITISGGTAAIGSGVIVNADVNASAAIAFSKMANLTVSRALVSDGSGDVSVSAVTATEIGYLDGVSSAIQTQIDSKQATIDSSNRLNANLVGDGSIDNTEFGYLNGVSAAIQTQLDSKQATLTGGATTIASSNLTVSRALQSNGSGKVEVSDVTTTELGYLDGVSSAIQTQLDTKTTPAFAVSSAIALG